MGVGVRVVLGMNEQRMETRLPWREGWLYGDEVEKGRMKESLKSSQT